MRRNHESRTTEMGLMSMRSMLASAIARFHYGTEEIDYQLVDVFLLLSKMDMTFLEAMKVLPWVIPRLRLGEGAPRAVEQAQIDFVSMKPVCPKCGTKSLCYECYHDHDCRLCGGDIAEVPPVLRPFPGGEQDVAICESCYTDIGVAHLERLEEQPESWEPDLAIIDERQDYSWNTPPPVPDPPGTPKRLTFDEYKAQKMIMGDRRDWDGLDRLDDDYPEYRNH